MSQAKRVRDSVRSLVAKFGSIHLHITGEGVVSFSGVTSIGNNGFIQTVFDGDNGCMTPRDDSDSCALDECFEFLFGLETAPRLGTPAHQAFVVEKGIWDAELVSFKEEIMNDQTQKAYIRKINASPMQSTPSVIIKITPEVNSFVVGEWIAGERGEFLGTIDEVIWDKDGTIFINVDDVVCQLRTSNQDELLTYSKATSANYRELFPSVGDYVVREEKSGLLVILPKEDWVGAFH